MAKINKYYSIGESFDYHGSLITCIQSDREEYACEGCYFQKKLHCGLKCDSTERFDHTNVIFIKEKRKKPRNDIKFTIADLKKRLKSEKSLRMLSDIERYINDLKHELNELRE